MATLREAHEHARVCHGRETTESGAANGGLLGGYLFSPEQSAPSWAKKETVSCVSIPN
jgi:hypothetical protein